MVLGVCDGIITSLVFASGAMFSGPGVSLSEALRIGLAAATSGAFTFFVADYARLRGELAHAAMELNLSDSRRLVQGKLGRRILWETWSATLLSGACSFSGACVPLAISTFRPQCGWLVILSADLALAVLGGLLARIVHGKAWRWIGTIVGLGDMVAWIGYHLHVVSH